MTKRLLLMPALSLLWAADMVSDQDMDGVPDNLDRCPGTSFLAEVDSQGCETGQVLIFPQERDSGSLDVVFGYGYSYNNDTVERNEQHVAKVQTTYTLHDWIYTLRTGYYTDDYGRGATDTIVKIKRRFKPASNVKLATGIGLRLPTYRFEGNRADVTLYLSGIYYPYSGWSIFGGYNHTFINDREYDTPLRDTDAFYMGSGYFFTKYVYLNVTYSYATTKFEVNPSVQTVASTLFYQFDAQWFATFTYSRELDTFSDNNAFNISIGYSVW